MSDWREDPTKLREYLINEKGYSANDLNSLQSEKVVDQLQAEFETHSQQQEQRLQLERQKQAEKARAEKAQALVDDTKRSPQARIAELLTMGKE